MREGKQLKVWDKPVRLFHWLLVAIVIVLFVTEDDLLSLHISAGYGLGVLLTFRIIWGFVGTDFARFSSFLYTPTEILGYLYTLLSGSPRRYLGHNPAGGAMVFTLVIFLFVNLLLGLLAQPDGLWLFALQPSIYTNRALFESLHEWLADFTLILITLHVLGVAVSSLMHRENLVLAMITGRKRIGDERD